MSQIHIRTKPVKRDLIDEAITQAQPAEASQTFESLEAASDEKMGREFLGTKIEIAGVKLRPFTLATAAMLKEIDSPLIQGRKASEIPNIIMDVLKMLVIQSIPLEEAVALVEDPVKLKMAAYKLGEGMTPDRTKTMVAEAMQQLKEATETQVKASPPPRPKGVPADTESGNDSSRRG